MAKDPALLFYTNDFLAGTFTMTDEQVGKYIRLLCLQHQKYELTETDMKNICKTYDIDIYSKFVCDNGKYHNVRLREEAERRKNYAESRRNNRLKPNNKKKLRGKKVSKSYVKHMETETVTETITKKLFKDSEFFNKGKFKEAFYSNPKYQKYDWEHYYEAVKNWSGSNNQKKVDWILTAYTWARTDKNPKTTENVNWK
jgi:hypothetical protein